MDDGEHGKVRGILLDASIDTTCVQGSALGSSCEKSVQYPFASSTQSNQMPTNSRYIGKTLEI